ncbi:MAG: hypothetical protein PHO56_04420 [Patescibacteria group bacterium]|nr:hypothetical protein [Patescibacteria group bacterium]
MVKNSKSVETILGKEMVCELTGRLMSPEEKIYVLPKLKKIIIMTIVSPVGPLFIRLTYVPFIPSRDWELYTKKKKAMGLLTNIRF